MKNSWTIADEDPAGPMMIYHSDYLFKGLTASALRALFDHLLFAPDPGPDPIGARHPEPSLYRGSFHLQPGWHRAGTALLGGSSSEPGPDGGGAPDLWDFNVEFHDLTPGVEGAILDAVADVFGPEGLNDAVPGSRLRSTDGDGHASLLLRMFGEGDIVATLAINGDTDSGAPRVPLVQAFVEAVGLSDQLAVRASDRSVAVSPTGDLNDFSGVDLRLGTAEDSGESRPAARPCAAGRPWFSVTDGPPSWTGLPTLRAAAGLCLDANGVAALARRLFAEPGGGWVREDISLSGESGPLVDLADRLAARGVRSWAQISYEAAYDVDAVLDIAAYADRLWAVVRAVTPPGGPPVALEVRRFRWQEPEVGPSEDPARFDVVAKYEEPSDAWQNPERPVGRWLDAVRALDPAHAASGWAED